MDISRAMEMWLFRLLIDVCSDIAEYEFLHFSKACKKRGNITLCRSVYSSPGHKILGREASNHMILQ